MEAGRRRGTPETLASAAAKAVGGKQWLVQIPQVNPLKATSLENPVLDDVEIYYTSS